MKNRNPAFLIGVLLLLLLVFFAFLMQGMLVVFGQ